LPNPEGRAGLWDFSSSLGIVSLFFASFLVYSQIVEKKPLTVKNYCIFLRYDSRTGTHNVKKEYRDVSICGAVQQMCMQLRFCFFLVSIRSLSSDYDSFTDNEMASRHAAQRTGIHIISASRMPAKLCERQNVKAFHVCRFPFPYFKKSRVSSVFLEHEAEIPTSPPQDAPVTQGLPHYFQSFALVDHLLVVWFSHSNCPFSTPHVE
jgi:large subunit ribosomal protein L18Ae